MKLCIYFNTLVLEYFYGEGRVPPRIINATQRGGCIARLYMAPSLQHTIQSKTMKYLLALLLAGTTLMGCQKEESEELFNDGLTVVYDLDGTWVLEDYPNTAYIFQDDLRYTVYCLNDCNWEEVTIADAIPGPESYTWSQDTLNIDLGGGNAFVHAMTFVCEGEVVQYEYEPGTPLRWYRPGFDIANCDE